MTNAIPRGTKVKVNSPNTHFHNAIGTVTGNVNTKGTTEVEFKDKPTSMHGYETLSVVKEEYTQEFFDKMNEELNTLVEVSKDTLKSYIKKASTDSINLASSGAYKLANTSADNQYKVANDDGEADDKKAVKRTKGISLAVDKLTKNENYMPAKPITGSMLESITMVMEASNPWKTYLRKEDENDHSGNVIHMAKHVGDADDLKKAKDIKARHMKEGSMYGQNMKDRNELSDKLWPKFKEKFAPK